jgi:hypothetical protein
VQVTQKNIPGRIFTEKLVLKNGIERRGGSGEGEMRRKSEVRRPKLEVDWQDLQDPERTKVATG